MSLFLNRFPDVATLIALFGPIGMWAHLTGRPLPEATWLHFLLLAIWMRLVKISWGCEERRTRRGPVLSSH